MSTANSVFIESKDPIFLILQVFLYCFWEKFAVFWSERTWIPSLLAFWDYQSPQLTLGSQQMFLWLITLTNEQGCKIVSYIIWLEMVSTWREGFLCDEGYEYVFELSVSYPKRVGKPLGTRFTSEEKFEDKYDMEKWKRTDAIRDEI